MQTIEYINGFKVISNEPDYTPEQQIIVNGIFLQKLYDILFNDNKTVDIRVK